MIPLTFLYGEYIDRPKLFEKNPFEYIVPPQQVGSEQKNTKNVEDIYERK